MKKNKYSTPLWMLATILAGMLSPMQSAVNGQLGHWLQDGNACAVISFASGLVVMFFIIMARKETRQQFAAIPSLIKNRKVPLWNWFAGLCGAMVVFSEGASASARRGRNVSNRTDLRAIAVWFTLRSLWYRCRRRKIFTLIASSVHYLRLLLRFLCVTAVAFYLFHLTCHSSVLSWFACRMAARWKCKSS